MTLRNTVAKLFNAEKDTEDKAKYLEDFHIRGWRLELDPRFALKVAAKAIREEKEKNSPEKLRP